MKNLILVGAAHKEDVEILISNPEGYPKAKPADYAEEGKRLYDVLSSSLPSGTTDNMLLHFVKLMVQEKPACPTRAAMLKLMNDICKPI